MRWPWQKRPALPENRTLSVSDPAIAAWFNAAGYVDLASIAVNEATALGLSAWFRAHMLIAGTLASLPLHSYSGGTDGTARQKVPSIFDAPDGPDDQTVYEWKESLFLHLLMHGRAGALKVRTAAGGLARLPLVHPLSFAIEQPTQAELAGKDPMPKGGVWFRVQLADGKAPRLDADGFWYVPGPSLTGQEGISLLDVARGSLATALAGEKATAKLFSSGAMISGMATPDYEDGS
jgi:phage portal protein BeeE